MESATGMKNIRSRRRWLLGFNKNKKRYVERRTKRREEIKECAKHVGDREEGYTGGITTPPNTSDTIGWDTQDRMMKVPVP
ncbi:hypothetical protein RUM44_002971 [Polyplax serrata]|uniref:Uncharacterized protein n=1 Tax=Polyplax serrata TaxID=468196 RepID=A0ABR1AXV1_POLSC